MGSNVDGNLGSSGHVVFVNEVRDYGNTVVITEYNFLSLNAYESPERVLLRYGAAQNSRSSHLPLFMYRQNGNRIDLT